MDTRKILFGAFDPLSPNGLMSCANGEQLFGLRVVTLGPGGELAERRSLDFDTLEPGPIDGDRYFTVRWRCAGLGGRLTWARLDERAVWGRLELEPGLTGLIELYIPREYRLSRRWPNFSIQAPRVLAGEMIAPFGQPGLNAVRLLLDRAPEDTLGYNDREAQLADFRRTGALNNLAPGDIWHDMGLSWHLAARFSGDVEFIYEVGDSEDFLSLPEPEEIDRRVTEGRARAEAQLAAWQAGRMTGLGALAGVPEAVEQPIRYNTMYREDTGRRFVMVDRPWVRDEDGWGIAFNWDTFLSSLSACWFDGALARENLRAGLDNQLPDGRIPLYAYGGHSHGAEAPITAGRSQHIVQGLTAWQTYLWTRDRAWLADCYPRIARAHAWWLADRGDGKRWRDGLGQGMIGFGYDPEAEVGVLGSRVQPYVAKAQYAYFETYDDSPQWTDGVFFKTVRGLRDVTEADVTDVAKYQDATHTANLYTLERCCLYAVDAECLAKMARELGLEEEAAAHEADRRRMCEMINTRMWDEADGCYYNLHFDGTLRRVMTPDSFMPLMTGTVPPERVPRLMAHMLDERTFWGAHKMPSVSRSDPAYADQKYWRGQIWPPQVLWTHIGLRRAGQLEAAWALAESASGMLRREWQENRRCPENYNGNTGRCSGSPHYNWGTLMGVVALNELMELEPDRVTFGRTDAPDGTGLRGIALDGHRYDVLLEGGLTRVWRDGSLAGENRGPVTLER